MSLRITKRAEHEQGQENASIWTSILLHCRPPCLRTQTTPNHPLLHAARYHPVLWRFQRGVPIHGGLPLQASQFAHSCTCKFSNLAKSCLEKSILGSVETFSFSLVYFGVYIVIWDGALWFWSVIKTIMTDWCVCIHKVPLYAMLRATGYSWTSPLRQSSLDSLLWSCTHRC